MFALLLQVIQLSSELWAITDGLECYCRYGYEDIVMESDLEFVIGLFCKKYQVEWYLKHLCEDYNSSLIRKTCVFCSCIDMLIWLLIILAKRGTEW